MGSISLDRRIVAEIEISGSWTNSFVPFFSKSWTYFIFASLKRWSCLSCTVTVEYTLFCSLLYHFSEKVCDGSESKNVLKGSCLGAAISDCASACCNWNSSTQITAYSVDQNGSIWKKLNAQYKLETNHVNLFWLMRRRNTVICRYSEMGIM